MTAGLVVEGGSSGSLLGELAEAGFPVGSLTELRTSGQRYRAAVPVLLRWLPLVSDRNLKEDLVRALSVPWARPVAARPLLDEFDRVEMSDDPTGTGLRWAIGNALSIVADDSVFDELVRIVENRAFGKARQMVVIALGRSKRREAVPVLIGLLDDDDVSGHAVKALAKLRSHDARPALERMVNDPRSWVRKEAQKALAKLGA
jgi:HEAT repeat protein